MTAEFLRRPAQRRAQIGPPHIADEQRVPGQHRVRFVRVLRQIEHQNRDRFDRVSRSLQYLQTQSRKFERIAIFHGNERVLRPGLCSQPDLGAAAVAQLEMSGNEVGMEVSQKDVTNLRAQPLGVTQILLDIALRIDHDGACAGFID